MRRRRKPRVVWLPQTNANSIGGGTEENTTVFQLKSITVPATSVTGASVTDEIPLVLDAQVSFADTGASLSDIENSGYRLRRIVGKIWAQVAQTDPGGDEANLSKGPVSVIVTAGLIVRRTRTSTGASLAAALGQISPATIENTGDPWIWRRSWILGNNFINGNYADLTEGGSTFARVTQDPYPPNNWITGWGGNADGPHVDQKTARIVSSEERLFLSLSTTVLQESGNPPSDNVGITTAFITDLRVLGSLRTTSGNRRNASR